MTLEWHEQEACARYALERSACDGYHVPPLRILVANLGWKISRYRPAKGTCGLCDYRGRTIAYYRRGDERVVTMRLAHEIGHIALHLAGYNPPHDEDDAEAVGLAIAMPRAGVGKTVQRVGLVPAALLEAYPHLPPAVVFRRVAQATDTIAIVYSGSQRTVVWSGYRDLRTTLPMEPWMVAMVRHHGVAIPDLGWATAWPFDDLGGKKGVVILADAEPAEGRVGVG